MFQNKFTFLKNIYEIPNSYNLFIWWFFFCTFFKIWNVTLKCFHLPCCVFLCWESLSCLSCSSDTFLNLLLLSSTTGVFGGGHPGNGASSFFYFFFHFFNLGAFGSKLLTSSSSLLDISVGTKSMGFIWKLRNLSSVAVYSIGKRHNRSNLILQTLKNVLRLEEVMNWLLSMYNQLCRCMSQIKCRPIIIVLDFTWSNAISIGLWIDWQPYIATLNGRNLWELWIFVTVWECLKDCLDTSGKHISGIDIKILKQYGDI